MNSKRHVEGKLAHLVEIEVWFVLFLISQELYYRLVSTYSTSRYPYGLNNSIVFSHHECFIFDVANLYARTAPFLCFHDDHVG